MTLSESDKVFISKLKSKLSKILCIKSKLPKGEANGLEKIYEIMDSLILQKDEYEDVEVLRDSLSNEYGKIEKSKKVYIRDQILPIVSEAVVREWGKKSKWVK